MEEMEPIDGIVIASVSLSAAQVALRSLILSAVVCRGSIENGVGNPDAMALHQRILDWLTQLNLWAEIEPSEEVLLRAPLGSLNSTEILQATWYVEGLSVLAWAGKRIGFPKHDTQVDNYEVTDALDFLDDTGETVIANAEIRSHAELEACRELLYAIHARFRDYVRNRNPKDFTRWIERSWLDTLDLSYDNLIAENDFAIDGKPIYEVEEKRLQEVMSITLERHRAIIWLTNGPTNYSETTVDT